MTGTRRSVCGDDARLLLALSLVPGMGNKRIHQFLSVLKGHGFSLKCLETDHGGDLIKKVPEMTTRFAGVMEAVSGKTLEEAGGCVRRARESGLDILHILDAAYPSQLVEHLDGICPAVLFLSGDRRLLDAESCAVVGTRSPSRAGIRAAAQAAQTIAGTGMTVASGGAFGVDRAAHDAALRAGGATIVFLPQGILTFPLPSAWKAAMEKGQLLLVSEYLPDAPWRTYAAVSRNALIAAQSRLVCVVEPGKQGGSILTARHALAQGKPVLVEPVEALPASLQAQVKRLDLLSPSLKALKDGLDVKAPRQSRLF